MDRRIAVWSYIIAIMFAVYFLRLWDLQIIKGQEFKKIAESNRLRIIETPAPRGVIYDRNDTPLVNNVPSFDISVVREDIPKNHDMLEELGRLVGLSPREIMAKVARPVSDPFGLVKLKQDVSLKEVAYVEARKMDFPALQVEVVISREYIYGDLASHVVGYLGYLTREQVRDPKYSDVPVRAFTGQRGVEKVFDRTLRGIAGRKIIEVDATGRMIELVGVQQPVKGSDIKLTIDIKLQSEAEDALEDRTGAVVVLDAVTGEILVLASSPAFDPNLFSRGISIRDWKRLSSDPKKPFLNRAIQSQYPPGSTFKIITALAALEEGVISENTRFRCDGSIDIGRVFKCWKKQGHGSIDLYDALVQSCDVYFYEVGKRMDIDILAGYAMDYGLGSPAGIRLEGERRGIVPSTEWKLRAKNQKWYLGETLNTVIGQGYLSATPLQMARLTAAAVNGGKLFNLSLLKSPEPKIDIEREIDISAENIELVKRALMGVVSDKQGTGWMARSDIVNIGGKTGTTQVITTADSKGEVPERFRDHAWFVAFAPEEEPEIAVAVFIEHGGHGSTAAAPVAKRVIEKYFKNREG